MLDSTITLAKLAEATGKDKSTLRRELEKRDCPFEWGCGNGGKTKYFIVSTIPTSDQLDLYRYNLQQDATANNVLDSTSLQQFADPTLDEEQVEELWRYYDNKTDTAKAEAEKRVKAVHEVISLIQRGSKKGAARKIIADKIESKPDTIRSWMKKVEGHDPVDWLAVIVPRYAGRQKTTEISPAAMDFFKADYLRLESPAASAVYRRLKQVSKNKDWQIPSLKTIQRKIKREISPQVTILAREGVEALMAAYPAQQRDRSYYHAMEAVNADGHKFDVFVKFPDGTVCRPVLLAWQDIYSGKFVGYRIAKTENKDTIRLSFGDMVENFGIPEHAYLDNGRGFAAKWLTGGTPNRYRFKIKDEDPEGILTNTGTKVHWCQPYHGQSKPIERAFRDFCEDIAKHPKFAGAYTGNSPVTKPENYGSKAVPYDVFMKVLDQGILAHNERPGRRSEVCAGRRSLDDAFNESYQVSKIRKATKAQQRLWLLAAEGVTVHKKDGSINLMKNRYHDERLLFYQGQKVVVRFDPDHLHSPIHVYKLDGKYICEAECIQRAGFGDSEKAREHNRLRNQFKKDAKKQLEREKRMTTLEAANMIPDLDAPKTPPSKVVEAMFNKKAANNHDAGGIDVNQRLQKIFGS